LLEKAVEREKFSIIYLFISLGLGDSGDDSLLNSALVDTSDDLEVSVHSPLGVPRVGDSPVGGSVGNSPSDDLDGVSSQSLSGLVDVDSAGVLVEVGVDGEGGLNGSVGQDLGLDGRDVVGNSVGRLSEPGVGSVGSGSVVLRDASLRASGGGGLCGWAALTAGVEEVWLAPLVVLVLVSGDDSGGHPVLPGLDGVSSAASVSAG